MSTLEDRMVGVELLVSDFDRRLKHIEERDVKKVVDKAQTAVNIAQEAVERAKDPRPKKLWEVGIIGFIVGMLTSVAVAKVLLVVHFW